MCNKRYFEDEDLEIQELKAQIFYQKRYESHYFAHPHCQDPDHPGCPNCEPEEYEDDN